MITINEDHRFPLDETLFVFALDSEAGKVFNDKKKKNKKENKEELENQ